MSMPATLPSWLEAEYPFARHSFTTPRGARLNYVDEGPRTDEAVLMLHGNPTWSFYYREVVRALAPTRRCIVPDHVGMGLSEKPQDYPYTLETRIADIEALVASLKLRRVHLLVHDWGGAIGFGFATRNPGLIGRIAILNTAAFAMNRIPRRIAACKLPVVGPLLVRGLNGFAGPATWMAMHRRALSATEKKGFLFPYLSWADRVAISAFVRDIPMSPAHPSWATLAEIEHRLDTFVDHPVLIIWGGQDFCFNDRFLERWRVVYPRATVERIDDAGHYVLEDAREDVLPKLTAFFGA